MASGKLGEMELLASTKQIQFPYYKDHANRGIVQQTFIRHAAHSV
ncbi:MAG: hypothetical protein QM484_04445 [Woeseiaceae bacterium]